MEVSVLSDPCRSEQTQRWKRGGLETHTFSRIWIETVMRRKYLEVTKDARRKLKKREDALVFSGGVFLTQKAWDEDVQ